MCICIVSLNCTKIIFWQIPNMMPWQFQSGFTDKHVLTNRLGCNVIKLRGQELKCNVLAIPKCSMDKHVLTWMNHDKTQWCIKHRNTVLKHQRLHFQTTAVHWKHIWNLPGNLLFGNFKNTFCQTYQLNDIALG